MVFNGAMRYDMSTEFLPCQLNFVMLQYHVGNLSLCYYTMLLRQYVIEIKIRAHYEIKYMESK